MIKQCTFAIGLLFPMMGDALVRVSNIGDINLGSYDFIPSGTFVQAVDSICVYSTTLIYSITFEQSGGSFELIGDLQAESLPYEVIFVGTSTPATASPGVPITGQLGNNLFPDCLGINNASVIVRVYESDFNLVAPDDYGATLEIMVEIE